jgi:hypothetical protein
MTYSFAKNVNVEKLKLEIAESSITIALESVVMFNSNLDITFKTALSTAEETTLNDVVEAHVYTIPVPESMKIILDEQKTSEGLTKVSVYEPEGTGATIATHDFSKKQTWYQQSVQVVGQALTSSDNLTFQSPHTFWIDLTHGLMYDEDNINVGGMYNPVIKIDGSIQTTGFTINYVTGAVTFSSPVIGIVTANYYYATTSYYVLKPKLNQVLAIKSAEVQFTTDIVIGKPFVFEAWVNHPTYGMIPVPDTKICYKNFRDFITACNEGQGLIPRIGDLQNDVHVFPFNYARPKPVKYSQGTEIRVYISDHTPIVGEYATATFYVTINDEQVAPS